jgi:NitT/TauT family transport system substrate-binding protein
MTRKLGRFAALIGLLLAATGLSPVRAQHIVVSNYGVAINGAPFAVAMERGLFREEGANVTGIITSAGGGTSMRNMIAGGVPYAEVNPTVAIAAIQAGADIRIISHNVLTVAEFVWAVRPDSPIQSMRDVRGRKLGYTSPRSTSQGLIQELVKRAGLQVSDVELVRTGGFGEGLAALESRLIDVTPIPEPLWSQHGSRFRAIARASESLPPLSNLVGVTTTNMAAERGDFIRAIIRGRRRAVEFMHQDPDAAGDIVARAYNIPPEVGRSAVRALTSSRTEGVPYWGPGNFNMASMERMVELQRGIGGLSGEIDLARMIDQRFLPEDLRSSR